MPDALAWQFEQAPALFRGLGWAVEDSDELEADDLLGSYALVEEAAGGDTLILTGDRDMYQCVTARTSVLYLKQGTSGFETVDRAEVERRYGIPPALVPTSSRCAATRPTDCPGPGIGEKTAAELLRRHGSLESCWPPSPLATPESGRGSRPLSGTTPTRCAPTARSRCCARSRSQRPADAPPISPAARRPQPRSAWATSQAGSRRRLAADL